jgi:hypothetical protein
MYGKNKEETYQINKAFMLNPDRWPFTGSLTERIYLKRYSAEEHRHDTGQLAYLDGQWSFCQETWDNVQLGRVKELDPLSIKSGGPELIEKILQEGWVVD